MEGIPHPIPRTVEETSRSSTSSAIPCYLMDVRSRLFCGFSFLLFLMLIEKENLCLYGLPNETWEVNLPVEEVPPELPEPALGINFARDGMQEKDWLSLVAVHSDSWLLSVAFYFGARFGFGKNERYGLVYSFCAQKKLICAVSLLCPDYGYIVVAPKFLAIIISEEDLIVGKVALAKLRIRAKFNLNFSLLNKIKGCSNLITTGTHRKRLFHMINDLPTIFEVVTGNVKQPKDQSVTHNNSSKNKSSGKSRQSESQTKGVKMSPPPKEEDESGEDEDEDDEQGATCGACGDNYGADEFWICCDICERWFHGKCVKITPAKAEHIKQYKCPSCSSKRIRV
ncbi:hypothetical protein FEM48_Zijuj08G0205900 [Ziziphus jujuba var. spinosa]|uniref:PHD finger protein ALFIN-LIKE n=1 Tax=Ziziphus jujuba var. spinosa TaxID=714518 RepID=A0A978V192_ZIZJJ|nr:hypothetical protein FEM48_Zijuj08G0205900 [Ziziphus jujuba var. spinosa]